MVVPHPNQVRAELRRRSLDFWLRETSPTFRWDWAHLQYIREHLEAQAEGELQNLMVLCPPQHGKSELVTVRYPVWRLEREPTLRVIVAAYNQSYVDKLARKARRIAVSNGVLRFAPDRNAMDEWELTTGGSFKAVGIGGGVTGNPAELALIDDPIKGRAEAESETYRDGVWDWYVDELSTRIQMGGQKLLILTPWHEDDLRGRILNSAEAKRWTVVRLPAIAEENDPLGREFGEPLCPERRSIEWLLDQKALNEHTFQALYQCNPTAKQGLFFSADKLLANLQAVPPPMLRMVRAWDLAASKGKGDWTVGVLMGVDFKGRYWILDVVRGQWNPDERNEVIRQTATMDGPSVIQRFPQDPGQAGKEQAMALTRMLAGYIVKTIPVSGDKVVRSGAMAAQINAGNVFLIQAAWNQPYVQILRVFPSGAHDDDVDASADAFNELTSGPIITAPAYSPLSNSPASTYVNHG
jgi:predicted phage terminase large subunit-like protein